MGSQTRVPFSPSSLVFERKFDVALRKSHGESFRSRLKAQALTPDDEQLFRAYDKKSRAFTQPGSWIINENVYPDLLLTIADAPSLKTSRRIQRVQTLVARSLEVQLAWVTDCLEPVLRTNPIQAGADFRRRTSKCEWLIRLVQAKEEFDRLVRDLPKADDGPRRNETLEQTADRVSKECYWESKKLGIHVCWSKFSCVLSHRGTSYYLPRSYLLLCHNKICDMISVFVYASACPDSLYGANLQGITARFFNIWAGLARRFGQKFFHISKVLEGLCIGETLIETEGQGNAEFLHNICDGIRENTGFTYEGSPLEKLLTSVSAPVRHELACLSKTMGHPFCDVEKGAMSLQEKVCANTLIDEEAVYKCVQHAKLDFIRKYLVREKQWPPVEMDEGVSRCLKFAALLGHDPTESSHQKLYGTFELSDLDAVTILKCLKFDWLENFIPYVKDRTVTLGRSAVIRRYIQNKKELRDNWKETRLLLYYLLQPTSKSDHLFYLEAFNDGNWEQIADYLVIRVVPKEKEHKIEARGFGCKTPADRARSIVQEENAARFLNDYSDEHVMTLGEISLAKKLVGFRNLGRAYPGYTRLTLSVDSSSWNNRFRHKAVAPVANAVLDSAYGTKIFQKTHLAYEKSFIYVPDADKIYYWDGQLGGIEGLNQDTWVYIYLQQMKVCMEGLPYPYYLLCKGDDLRVSIMVPPEVMAKKTLDVIKQEILTHVSERGKLFGHVIKVEDSYVSEHYFAYSKDAYVKGVEQPQTFRKIQKCYGANNAFLTTPDDYIASSYSNAHSASKTAPSPVQCFAVALYWMYDLLTGLPEYSALSDEDLAALSMVPNLIGGFPIIFLHNFFVRAESDLLTPFLDLVCFTRKYYPGLHAPLGNFLRQKTLDPDKHLGALLMDPYSLPLARPPTASSILRGSITELVRKTTRNEDLKELFSAIKDGFEEAFLDVVRTANIYNVKLLGILYSSTPEGIIRTLVRKFETGRSIYNALILHSGRGMARRVLVRCLKAERAVHEHRIALIKQGVKFSDWIIDLAVLTTICPYSAGLTIRSTLWGKRVTGITHPPLQHIMEIGRVEAFGGSDDAAYNHFEIMFDLENSDPQNAPLFTTGKHDPFTGDSTGKGLHHPDATILSHNMLSSKVRDLIDVLQWGNMTGWIEGQLVTSNLPTVAEHILKAYTTVDVSDLVPFKGGRVIGRTTQHHVRVNNYRVSIVPNTLLNLYTRAKGTSHAHRTFYHSTDHYLVNFLQVFCHAVSLWALPWWCGEGRVLPDKIWMVTRTNCPCMAPIEEEPVVLGTTDLPVINLMSACRLGEQAVGEILAEVKEFNPKQYYVEDGSVSGLTLEEAQIALAQAHCNAVVAARHTLKALYTSHATTAEGYKALERYGGINPDSATEALDLRYVPPSILLKDVAVTVYTEILHRYRLRRVRHMGVMLGLTPALELPWTTLLRDLDFAGVWYSVQQELHRQLPTMYDLIHDNPVSAAPSFGAACYEICRGDLRSYKLAYLSYNPSPVVEKDIHRRLQAIRLDVIRLTYLPMLSVLDSEDADPTRKKDILCSLSVGLTSQEHFTFPFDDEANQQTRATHRLFEATEDLDEYLATGVFYDDSGEMKWTPPPLVEAVCRSLELSQDEIYNTLSDVSAEETYNHYWNLFIEYVGDRPVEVFRTSRTTCINRVRAERLPSYHHEGTKNSRLSQALPEVKRRRAPSVEVTRFLNHQASDYAPVGLTWGVIEDEEFKGTYFNKRWTLRPLGAGNISMSKALSIIDALEITPLPPQLSIACLGDGYGGYSAVLSQLSSQSWILFNTKPNRQGSQQEPIYAVEVAALNGNEVNFSENLLGHYDLTERTTYERFERITDGLDIITLDAELKPIICSQRLEMLHYVATLFVRRGRHGSLLLMKVTTEEGEQWLSLLGWLVPRCSHVYLMKATATPLDGELMLVAQLNDPDPDRPYQIIKKWPPVDAVTKLHEFAHVRYNRWIKEDEGGLNELGLRPNFSPLWISSAKRLPLYGWSKIHEVCRLGVSETCKYRRQQREDDWLAEVDLYVSGALAQIRMELRNASADKRIDQYNTVRHEVYVLEKFAAVSGFGEAVRLYRRGGAVMTAKDFKEGYAHFVRSYPGRLDLARDIEDHYQGPITRGGYSFHPLKRWKLGLRWGVAALSISRLL
ncbi:polymerase [Karukera tick virus]|uniref:RNA-directed RNA polymerase L n=1 Tax=Karukera tick virus TaxID=2678334 RepID=A0A6B9CKY4_9VIRU|nr:polymerase [Karukera tick virus]QGW51122.1 polymerase [Karukera tick virus]